MTASMGRRLVQHTVSNDEHEPNGRIKSVEQNMRESSRLGSAQVAAKVVLCNDYN